MSESWSWNVLSPPHTLVLWSSEFYSQLWLLMRMWLKGTEQLKKKKKKYCENSRSVVLAVLTPPSPFASWELPSRSWCPPPSLKRAACPILSVPISKPLLRFQARLCPRLLPGWSGQPRGRTVSPRHSHPPCMPTSRELGVSWLSSHGKWTHIIECTWLSRAAPRATTSCSDSDTNEESCAHKILLQL